MEKDQNRKLVSVNSMEPWKPCERGKWRKTKRTKVLQAQRLKRSGTGRVPQNYIKDNVSWTETGTLVRRTQSSTCSKESQRAKA